MKQTIKILLLSLSLFLIIDTAKAQVPQLFNYQGIARDAKGNPLSNQKMSLKLSVLPTADATVAEYEETQMVNTNEFGLYTLQIGNGTAVTGEMKNVKWETGNKYIKVAIDPTGGTNYTDAGTNQLLSVPYAIYADKAGVAASGGNDKTRSGTVSTSAAGTGTVNFLTKFTAANTIYNSQIFDNGTNIGIGTTAPAAKFQITNTVAAVQEHIRMQNLSATGAGRFTMYNDGVQSYATFTKYGSTFAGGYVGVAAMYPYANLLAFGNNGVAANDGQGRFLISTGGNVGISMLKGGTSKLKFHADFTSENVGIGGNAAPVNRVHLNNSDGTDMTVGVTNNTSGHTAADGLVIRENGNAASIINRENSTLDLGTNNTTNMTIDAFGNVGVGTVTPTYKLDVTHSGSTGILSKSTGSYSTIDIDASSGDAALRYMGNGSFMWNVRNEPASNDYQIFQMSAAAERMRINSATGNVGIGTSTAISRLHVVSDISNDTAIFATSNDPSANNQIGVLGTYNTSGFGAGVVGRGFGGTVPPLGAQDIGVYGSSSGIAMWSNGPMRITDGTQATGRVLTSDASGNASWQQKTISSAFAFNDGTPIADTSIDGTVWKRFIYNAPDITAGDLTSSAINVYLTFGAGTFVLPYTSGAGGGASTIMALPAVGKIFLLRMTHATPGTASIGMSGALQIRYVINRP